MKKLALIALALAVLSVIALVAFDGSEAYAGLFVSAGADCDGDGIDDVTCSGGTFCQGEDHVGCECWAGSEIVDAGVCPDAHK